MMRRGTSIWRSATGRPRSQPSARVAIADEASGRLWIFDPDGRRLGALAGLAGPRALAFAGGSLLVAEARAGRVVRIALERALPPRAAE